MPVKDDVGKLAKQKQQISQKMIILVQHNHHGVRNRLPAWIVVTLLV